MHGPGADTMLDGVPTETESKELVKGRHAVLASREFSETSLQ
jgi:hypothetical protein